MELAPVNPIERHLPDFKLSDETAILQVGLFRQLKGAALDPLSRNVKQRRHA